MPVLKVEYSTINQEEMAASIGVKSKYISLLIESFLRESVSLLDALRESINAKDYEKIKSNAHALKGSAGNLRFSEIYEMAKEIEYSAAEQNRNFDYNAYFEAIKSAIGTITN